MTNSKFSANLIDKQSLKKMKFDSKNPYRNLIKNLRKIIKSEDVEQKEKDLNNLSAYAQTQCLYTFLLSNPALKFFNIDDKNIFDKKKDHSDFKLNPWEMVRTEFLNAMTRDRRERDIAISKSLMWFDVTPRTTDWLI